MGSPRFGEPARVAFVGLQATSGQHALHAPAGGIVPRFFDVRPGDDAAELAAALHGWGAHAVVVLGLDALPGEALAALPAVTLGVATAPLDAAPAGFDRVVARGPDPAAWRSLALPVDDRLYADVRPGAAQPRALFVGASTEHREKFLVNAKHSYDLLHYAHGLHGEDLRDVLGRTDVAVCLHHDDDEERFEDDVLVHLAAGQLVVSEPLTPSHGLEPGIDFLEIRRPDELLTTLYQLQRRPDAFERVRARGRAKADDYRASRIWPRVVADLFADVRAFGTARAIPAVPA
jgi:hypothetical protein